MEKKIAYIICERVEIPYDKKVHIVYRWKGKNHLKVVISLLDIIDIVKGAVKIGSEFQLGPIPLKITKITLFDQRAECYRTDVGFGLIAWFHYVIEMVYPVVMKIWWRILATMKIWGIIKADDWDRW